MKNARVYQKSGRKAVLRLGNPFFAANFWVVVAGTGVRHLELIDFRKASKLDL